MSIVVDVNKYLALNGATKRIKDYLSIEVADHAYLPKTEDIKSDWVAYIAAPAFKLIREKLGHDIDSFVSIGTPTDTRIISSGMPAASLSFGESCECVLVAGCKTLRLHGFAKKRCRRRCTERSKQYQRDLQNRI